MKLAVKVGSCWSTGLTISSVHPLAFFTVSVQLWYGFHEWLAEIARLGDGLHVGWREGMRILAGVTGFNGGDQRRTGWSGAEGIRSSVWGVFTEMPVKHPKEMLKVSLLYPALLARMRGTYDRQLFWISLFFFTVSKFAHIDKVCDLYLYITHD